MDLTQPGTVGKLYVDNCIEVFLLRDKEENGVLDPDPQVYACTPKSINDLPTLSEAQVKEEEEKVDQNTRFERFTVFDQKTIAWKRQCVFEGAFHGTTVTFSGPFLITE
jgi:hypothetical protein